MHKIESTISFPNGLPINKELIDKEFQMIINSEIGTLAFPKIPSNYKTRIENFGIVPFDNNLEKPKNANIELSNNIEWGVFIDNNGNSCIKSCQIWFPCNKRNIAKIISELQNHLKYYLSDLMSFLEIFSGISIDETTCGYTKANYYRIFWLNDEKNKIIKSLDNNIEVSLSFPKKFISYQEFEKSIDYVNKKFKPNIAYKLLTNSIHNRNIGEFRRSVIDACTAIEISLTKRIELEFDRKGINDVSLIKKLLSRFHSLSGRLELISTLNIELPRHKKEYLELLSKARNDSVHQGYVPTSSEVDRIIEIASDTLKKYIEYYE